MTSATATLAVNGLFAWALQGLLSPHGVKTEHAASPLQVVFITAPRRSSVIAPTQRRATMAPASRAIDRPLQAAARLEAEASDPAVEIVPTRPMTAVYLHQARRWAQQQPAETVPADPFANRPIALAQQPGSRFRLARPLAPADAVAMVGQLLGGAGYATDNCALIRGRIVGLVTGGDAQAVQQDLDYQRRHCRP